MSLKIIETLMARNLRPAFTLFLGPADDEKKAAALFLASACLCLKPTELKGPCQECRSCLKIGKGVHPDVHLINKNYQEIVLKSSSEASQLKVETVRKVLRELKIRPFESAYSLAIVEDAQDLNIQAQNALLKILEETPRHVLWIWLASSVDYLLPTVVSRANFKIYFKPKEPLLAEDGPVSLTKRQVFEMSQRVARFRRAFQARKEVGQILEEMKFNLYGQWQKEGNIRPLLGLKIILQAQKDLELNITPALVLESALLRVTDQILTSAV